MFGLIGVIAVLIFVRKDRQDTLKTYAELMKAGAAVQSVDVQATGTPPIGAAAVAANAVSIEGPATVIVGVPSNFIAKQAGSQVVATWAADPAAAAADLGDPTSRVSLVAKQAGAFTLSATVAGAAAPGSTTVTALPAAATRHLLPFVGAGWGSVVVAVVIASVTGALGVVGALTGEGVATILGALVGYVVPKGAAEHSPTTGSGNGSSATPSGAG